MNKKLLDILVTDHCPSDIGLPNPCDPDADDGDCVGCWTNTLLSITEACIDDNFKVVRSSKMQPERPWPPPPKPTPPNELIRDYESVPAKVYLEPTGPHPEDCGCSNCVNVRSYETSRCDEENSTLRLMFEQGMVILIAFLVTAILMFMLWLKEGDVFIETLKLMVNNFTL